MKSIITICLLSLVLTNLSQRGKGKLVGVYDLMETPDFKSKKIPKEIRPYVNNMVLIPSGSFYMGAQEEEFTSNYMIRTASSAAFYMSEVEVPNWQYREFCADMKDTLGPDSLYHYLPDTLCWLKDKDYSNDALADYYFNHTAYDNYPVVGVSQIQADLFCNWLTEKVKLGLNQSSKTNIWPSLIYFTLPTEVEWEMAARGGIEGTSYPWGNELYGRKKDCGFKAQANSGAILDTNKQVSIPADFDGYKQTCPIYEYNKNEYGLYNMSGNVSEWTKEIFSLDLYEFTSDLPVDNNFYPWKHSDSTKLIIKGGSYNDLPYFLRSAVRRGVKANTQSSAIGFRVVIPYFDRSNYSKE